MELKPDLDDRLASFGPLTQLGDLTCKNLS